jgi:glycosyltransferase involved in cell wall biosynthesis
MSALCHPEDEAGERSQRARRLRILQVIAAYYPAVRYGGPIRSARGLAAALVRRGHDVHVYTTSVDGDSDLDVPLDRPVDLDGVAVHYFRVPALRRLCWSPALGERLRRSIAEFDVLHVHAIYLWPTWAAARAAARAGVPYVVSPRGMLIRDAIRGRSRWVKRAWIQLIERNTLARAAGLHVTAEVESTELDALRLPRPPVSMEIPNGIERPASYPSLAETPFAELPRPYVLYLGRLSRIKGLDRLIAAWQWIREVPLVIAGNDDEDYRPTLESMARSLGVAGRVLFVGPVPDALKWALYESAQLFVLPSYSENFGNAVAEAMAMGCPAVVSEAAGIASLIAAERAGVVTSCEPPQLAQVIAALLTDPARRRELGERGREAAHARLSWEAVAGQMEALYRSSVEGAAPRQAPSSGSRPGLRPRA